MEIGYFQFENLIHNRVPFRLIGLDIDMNFTHSFNPMHKLHLKNCLVSVASHEKLNQSWIKGLLSKFNLIQIYTDEILKNNFSKHDGLILICKNGEHSKKVQKKLEELGFLNVYFYKDGLEKLLQEVQNEAH